MKKTIMDFNGKIHVVEISEVVTINGYDNEYIEVVTTIDGLVFDAKIPDSHGYSAKLEKYTNIVTRSDERRVLREVEAFLLGHGAPSKWHERFGIV